MLRPCFNTIDELIGSLEPHEVIQTKDWSDRIWKLRTEMAHIVEWASIYVYRNWDKVTWENFEGSIFSSRNNKFFGEKNHSFIPVIGKIKEITSLVLDPTDGDMSITLVTDNGDTHDFLFLNLDTIIDLAEYIKSELNNLNSIT